MKYSDEYWESQGFKKVFLPELNKYAWSKEVETNSNVDEITNLLILEALEEMYVKTDEFELAAKVRDRISHLKTRM
jgi:protein-arginine kinase activator protein McsA